MLFFLFTINLKAQVGTSPNSSFKLTFEKTYLHTDRDVYAPGDTLWFKAYLVNAQDNKLATTSNNLYVDLVSPDSKIISSEMIRLDKGLGNGDFSLLDSLPSGTYRLRAYTNWMRNFGDNFIFEKQFTVVSNRDANLVDAKSATTGKNKKIPVTNALPASASISSATINFFPEGGSLIEGVNSIVAVKVEDGKPAIGAVISSAGDTVARFACDSLGMGLFAILPLKGLYYRAVVKGISYPLPAALNKGLALQVRHADSLLRVVVTRSDTSVHFAVLTVKHAGITILSQRVELTNVQVAARVPVNGLPEGVSAITLYDSLNHPQCERLVYIHHPGFGSVVTIKTDKAVYSAKEKVELAITAEPNASLSIAVADAGFVDADADNIISNLMLSSELRGHIDRPARYFDTTNINRFKQLDLLLLTQGWRDFVWRRLVDTAIHISYAAEDGVLVSGTVSDYASNKPFSGLNISLFASKAVGNTLFSTQSDSAGHFSFSNVLLYGDQKSTLSAIDYKGERRGAFTIDTLSTLPEWLTTGKKSTITALEDSLFTLTVKRNKQLKPVGIKGITSLKEIQITAKKDSKQAIKLQNGNSYTQWGVDQTLVITPKDYEYKTLSWFLLQKAKNAIPIPNGGVVFLADGKKKYPIFFINGVQPYV